MYPKLQRIADMARQRPEMSFLTLNHYLDLELLREAYRRTRKDGAPGVDGQTGREYAQDLEGNLRSLLDRAKNGDRYRAPPVRRVHIPKGKGKETRPIGIPTFEDKVLQRAVAMVLEAIYEQDFYDCSYGFRPGRSAHGALEAVWQTLRKRGGWVVEVDIRRFFDSVERHHMREILRQRVRDGVLIRLIGKWLHAGVMEEGRLSRPSKGTPQGGVISPLLSNIFLHEVLDRWWHEEVAPRLNGEARLIRYADDFVLVFQSETDADRVMAVLAKRFARYGLTLHPKKTRKVRFTRPPDDGPEPPDGGSFDLLGFTHYWGESRKGNWVVSRKTARDRLARAITTAWIWCRRHRHRSLKEQQRALARKLRGHYEYYGLTRNYRAMEQYFLAVRRAWRFWLDRRSNRGRMRWKRFVRLLEHYTLPAPRVVHSALRPRAANP